jgi:uncharacterized membrane protein YphA (DoxX/SURF4 family)
VIRENAVEALSNYTYQRSNWLENINRDSKNYLGPYSRYVELKNWVSNNHQAINALHYQKYLDSKINTYNGQYREFIDSKENCEKYAEYEELKDFWDDFETRKNTAVVLAAAYGALQGWGMAGFVLSMCKNAGLDSETQAIIGLAVALPVMYVNACLVHPDLEEYIAFKKYKNFTNGNFLKTSIAKCSVASVLLAAVVSFGITNSITTDNVGAKATLFVVFTAVLSVAEGLLNMESLDKAERTSYDEKRTKLLGQYADQDKKYKAELAFNSIYYMSLAGMIGIALVGTKCLANNIDNVIGNDDSHMYSMIGACVVLIWAALQQRAFYQDRASRITQEWITPDNGVEHPIPDEKLVFERGSNFVFGLRTLNGFLNAPCAYLGVVTTLGKFMGMHKLAGMDNTAAYEKQNTFEQIFFQYGNSIEANIIYSIGTLVFLAAVGISMAANSVPPQKIADPKKEYEMKRLRA